MSDLLEKAKTGINKVTDSLGVTDSQNTKENSFIHKSTLGNSNYPSNKACVFEGEESVVMKDIGYPEFLSPTGDSCPHGAIVKVIASCICGSDLHMYRARTSAGKGFVFGHEITGLVVETGPNVEIIKVGDVVSLPFNISCGLCDNCKQGRTSLCLRVNKQMPGGAYGYADMGGWQGGQAQYVLAPYADWNCMQLPKELVPSKILDFALLTDVLPTAMNGCAQAKVGLGSTVLINGAGPIGLGAIISAFLLGASHVICTDFLEDRLKMAANLGAKVINLSDSKFKLDNTNSMPVLKQEIEKLIGVSEVNCSVDCVGYEASQPGKAPGTNNPEVVLNTCFACTGAGGGISFPGIYLPMDPKGPDSQHKKGLEPLMIGNAFVKGHTLQGGQCPVMQWNKKLLKLICADRLPPIAKAFNVKVITLDEVPEAYKKFNAGEPCKYVIDCNGFIKDPSLIDKEIAQRNPNYENDKDKNWKMTPSYDGKLYS